MLRIPGVHMDIFETYPQLLEPGFVQSFDFETCYTVQNPDGPISEYDAAIAIMVSRGNFAQMGRMLRRSRRVMEGFVTRHEALSELAQDIAEEDLDDIEAMIKSTAKIGDVGAGRFILTTLGKQRGFTTRTEVTGPNGKELNSVIVFKLPDNGRDGIATVEEPTETPEADDAEG